MNSLTVGLLSRSRNVSGVARAAFHEHLPSEASSIARCW
jgi:hypothetical protein